jgi:hypothetical protein
MHQLANTKLNEKQKAELVSSGDGFYKSKREWLGKHHVILAFERYRFWFFSCLLFNYSISMNEILFCPAFI